MLPLESRFMLPVDESLLVVPAVLRFVPASVLLAVPAELAVPEVPGVLAVPGVPAEPGGSDELLGFMVLVVPVAPVESRLVVESVVPEAPVPLLLDWA